MSRRLQLPVDHGDHDRQSARAEGGSRMGAKRMATGRLTGCGVVQDKDRDAEWRIRAVGWRMFLTFVARPELAAADVCLAW
jgi:hypothetical protein